MKAFIFLTLLALSTSTFAATDEKKLPDLSKKDVIKMNVVPTLNKNANRCGDAVHVENQVITKGYNDSRGVFHQKEKFGRAVATMVPEGQRGCGR
jgi:hypothetical protein